MSKQSAKPVKQVRSANAGEILVFGRDTAGKPRAGYFTHDDAAIATKAAEALGLKVTKIGTIDRSIVSKFKPGRVHAVGYALVPFVEKELFARVSKSAGLESKNGKSGLLQLAIPKPHRLPTNWEEIDVADLVLAHESAKDGWWEAIVVEKNADMLTMRWRDFPRMPIIARHRSTIALLRPTIADAK